MTDADGNDAMKRMSKAAHDMTKQLDGMAGRLGQVSDTVDEIQVRLMIVKAWDLTRKRWLGRGTAPAWASDGEMALLKGLFVGTVSKEWGVPMSLVAKAIGVGNEESESES